MEEYVNTVLAHPAPGDAHLLITYCKGQDNNLQQHLHQLPNVLAGLDFGRHSLGVLFVLDAQARALPGQGHLIQFLEHATHFLHVCTSHQIQLVPEKFCHFCRRFKDLLVTNPGSERLGVKPLLSAVRKLQYSPEYLTPIQPDFLQLCLLSKCYSSADQLLREDVYEVDPSKTALTPTDFQLYAYYGGMVCTGLKCYSRALELFLQGITAPSNVCNAIAVASFKKYLLLCLIHIGTAVPLPKFTPTKVKSVTDMECRAYHDLAAAFASQSTEKLRKACEQHNTVLTNDGNLGLAKLVQQGLTKRNIQRLTQTYLTLSLADIASKVGLGSAEEAEAHVLRMVEAGEIFATINQRDNMVQFLDDPQQYNSVEVAVRIDSQIQGVKRLADKLQSVNEAVSLDRAYLSKATLRDRTARFEAPDEYLGTAGLYQP